MTDCVPPPGDSVYELPSLPLTTTWDAFVAVTVNVEELPVVIDVGLAAILTVAVGVLITVTVAVADALPWPLLAVAVYVVVAPGLTICVPPEALRLYALPSLPEIVTCVAFMAVTVRVDVAPDEIEVGFAAIVTAAVFGKLFPLNSAHPEKKRQKGRKLVSMRR